MTRRNFVATCCQNGTCAAPIHGFRGLVWRHWGRVLRCDAVGIAYCGGLEWERVEAETIPAGQREEGMWRCVRCHWQFKRVDSDRVVPFTPENLSWALLGGALEARTT